jgi:DNA-binding NarL/FixJ family response regulator
MHNDMSEVDKNEELKRVKKALRDERKKNERLSERLKAAKQENRRLKGGEKKSKKKAGKEALDLLTEKELEVVSLVFPDIDTGKR